MLFRSHTHTHAHTHTQTGTEMYVRIYDRLREPALMMAGALSVQEQTMGPRSRAVNQQDNGERTLVKDNKHIPQSSTKKKRPM